ncbi:MULTISPECIES: dienelactone hydrolase family protein [Pseudoalteromonas]|uniref:Dienelactone hydrolase domain-containing protein n=1 Tax=Pseudoalteromonas lipolytica TaxID=570156 RepID=A0AAD0WC27_9GAMM|nr:MULTISPECIES: dienelactone hydrolase family protein [Pseudoalteromonas]AXV65018.1 hypothetical protein D0907_06975 [Pseudoalteromonas donghaensis]MAE02098.1 hypothetical protein [Pseudoalteromonas sp.]QLJ09524.1 dienelactone hydrolase family protein [Pseudoalteromonas sp. JSTW]QPL44112.1 dienelactone hydrolase family protein [Pseudoalteromonas sp. A41-2]|tara:strand:- start:1340 stop:1912 length:573 start_codon:yes stop_codon:yes gene_type:complete
MNYLLVSDIFGNTAHLSQLAQQLSGKVSLCEPYLGEIQTPVSEHVQYQHFLNQCGHDTYLERVYIKMAAVKRPTTIIAFSAGASAVWRAQAELQNPYIKKIIAFYPSQVRNHLDLSATVPCQFIFAHSEAHFDIAPVVATLRDKPNVSCEVSQYAHGFMNPLSDNFDHAGYQAYIEQLFTKKCNEQLVTN